MMTSEDDVKAARSYPSHDGGIGIMILFALMCSVTHPKVNVVDMMVS